MDRGDRKVLVCNCEKTMQIDGKKLARALGEKEPLHVHSHLCRAEAPNYLDALKGDESLLVCCTQEAPLFRELASEKGKADQVRFTNIRERAGWSQEGATAVAKMAALVAEAALEVRPAGLKTLRSDGVCLVYGNGDVALATARKLGARLDVSLLLADASDMTPPAIVDVPIYRGIVARAAGHFGAFDIVVDGYAPAVPSSRAGLEFVMPRDGASSRCSIIFDISGRAPLFSQHERMDGYFHLDPGDRAGIAEAILEASDLVGEFEKPLYVDYDGDICAHSRSGLAGCSRCLDICPMSAVSRNGDEVVFDPMICGGCGGCASVCPTGAASYTMPDRVGLLERLAALLPAYHGAGGKKAVILVHDENHGAEMIAMLARHYRGLPANVLPFSLNQVTQLGHEVMAAALAMGAQSLFLLIDPRRRDEISGTIEQAALVNRVLGAMAFEKGDERLVVIDEQDPEAVDRILWAGADVAPMKQRGFTPNANKREVARTAFWALNDGAPARQQVIALESGAPYGRITVDTTGCTMCLACVSACPMGAIRDNPDRPLIALVEQDCVQCGLCARTCPEKVITLEPRLNLTNEAMSAVVLHQEEPAECIRCGKAFGSKGSIERIVTQLAGKHSMFQSKEAQDLIRMCDDCRIRQQAENKGNPFAFGERPLIRTTEDYLREEEEAAAGGNGKHRSAGEDGGQGKH